MHFVQLPLYLEMGMHTLEVSTGREEGWEEIMEAAEGVVGRDSAV